MNLTKEIHAKIKQEGYLTFDEFIDMSLYFPNYGYYNNPNTEFGPKNSDFITAPEISEIYTCSILKFYKDIRKHKKIENVLEFGAGSGAMAFNFLNNCDAKNLPNKYYIVEKNIHLIEKQNKKLKKLSKNLYEKIVWVKDIKAIDDVFIIANEILDAIPAKFFKKKDDKFFEKSVKEEDEKLVISLLDCKEYLLEEIYSIESRLGNKIPNSYSFEINFLQEKFLSEIFNKINNFILLIIDYGYHEEEFFHPQRKNGTVQFYKNHCKIEDIFSYPHGSFDISVSVDFSRVFRTALNYGIKLYSFTTQSQFLLNTNILEFAQKIEGESDKNNILKTLLFPSDMGENFKIMVLCDDISGEFQSSFKDFRHKL